MNRSYYNFQSFDDERGEHAFNENALGTRPFLSTFTDAELANLRRERERCCRARDEYEAGAYWRALRAKVDAADAAAAAAAQATVDARAQQQTREKADGALVTLFPGESFESVPHGGYRCRSLRAKACCNGPACGSRVLMYNEPFMTLFEPSHKDVRLCELCFDDPEARQQCGGRPMTRAVMLFRPVCTHCHCEARLDCDSYEFSCGGGACSSNCVYAMHMDPTLLGVPQARSMMIPGCRGGQAHPVLYEHVIWRFSALRRQDERAWWEAALRRGQRRQSL